MVAGKLQGTKSDTQHPKTVDFLFLHLSIFTRFTQSLVSQLFVSSRLLVNDTKDDVVFYVKVKIKKLWIQKNSSNQTKLLLFLVYEKKEIFLFSAYPFFPS